MLARHGCKIRGWGGGGYGITPHSPPPHSAMGGVTPGNKFNPILRKCLYSPLNVCECQDIIFFVLLKQNINNVKK